MKNLSGSLCRMDEAFLKTAEGKRLKSEGLTLLGAQERRLFEGRSELNKQVARLRDQMLAPVGRLFQEEASQKAIAELRALSGRTEDQRNAISLEGNRHIKRTPYIIFPANGSTVVSWAPFDDQWTDMSGGVALANKVTGVADTSIGMAGDSTQYAAAGILVWVVPQSAGDVLYLSANLHLQYHWSVETEVGPTAHSDGYFNILIRVHDALGGVIDPLTQDQREQLWSAGSSGLHYKESGANDVSREPFEVLRGGAYYEVWFWIQNFGDSGDSFWGGWSAAYSQLVLQLERIQVTEVG